MFLYVNSTFAPALDEIVGNLHRVSCPSIFLGMARVGKRSCDMANFWLIGSVFGIRPMINSWLLIL